ncbi:hypothetical protein OIE74_33650 [Streptomyces sp. NBC_01716]
MLAGLADLALSTCGSALKAVHALVGRSDVGSLAAQGRRDLQARGRLAVDRLGAGGTGTGSGLPGGFSDGLFGTRREAHMEVLARHAQLRAAAGGTGA